MNKVLFRISLNLKHYFSDFRASAKICINDKIKTIFDLEEKIKRIFGVQNFHLVCNSQLLPGCEEICLLQNEDIVWVVPNRSSKESGLVLKKKYYIHEVHSVSLPKKRPGINGVSQVSSEPAKKKSKISDNAHDTVDQTAHKSLNRDFELNKHANKTNVPQKNENKLVRKSKKVSIDLDKSNSGNSIILDLDNLESNSFLANTSIASHNNENDSIRKSKNVSHDAEKFSKPEFFTWRKEHVNDDQESSLQGSSCDSQSYSESNYSRSTIGGLQGHKNIKCPMNSAESYKMFCNTGSQNDINNSTPQVFEKKKAKNITVSRKSQTSQTNNYDTKGPVTKLSNKFGLGAFIHELRKDTSCQSSSSTEEHTAAKPKRKRTHKKKPRTDIAIFKVPNIPPAVVARSSGSSVHHLRFDDLEEYSTSVESNPVNYEVITEAKENKDYKQHTNSCQNEDVKGNVVDVEENANEKVIIQSVVSVKADETTKSVEMTPTQAGESSNSTMKTDNDETSANATSEKDTSHDSDFTMRQSKEEEEDETFEKSYVVNEEVLLKQPSMHLTLPRSGDVIAFKILKLTESYMPEPSSFIIGRVKSYDVDTGNVVLKIIFGESEFQAPKGKFFMEEAQNEKNEKRSLIQECQWKSLIETRLIYP